MPLRRDAPTPDEARAAGRAWLMRQARAGFPGTAHVMAFPRWAGFLRGPQRQSSDLFTRSVLAGMLLDIADEAGDDPAWQAELRHIAGREAVRIAAARLRDRAGGWSYFPELPELPPDLDSLAAAVGLFARVAPQHLPLCEEPIRLALAQRRADGGIGTWLIAPDDPPALRARMRRGIERHWGDTVDVEVCGRFYGALRLADAAHHASVLEGGTGFLLAAQQPDGAWPCTWYWSPASAMELCLPAFDAASAAAADARRRACRHLEARQHPDGGWGRWESVPLDTALALTLLCDPLSPKNEDAVARGIDALCDQQTLQGHWKATPWIRMDIGRAQGATTRTATYGCETLSTVACMRALLRAS